MRLRRLMGDYWLVIAVATLNIGTTTWLAMWAIQWRTAYVQQEKWAERTADWINDRIPALIKQEIEHGSDTSDGR